MLYALYVMLGASLWATDTIFRHPLVSQFSPITIVFIEHLIATVFALVVAIGTLYYQTIIAEKSKFPWKKFFPSFSSLFALFQIGILGSALATVLFTYSFSFVNPSVSILLQKIQPILVIVMSAIFLNESLPRFFIVFASLAVAAAFFVSFPHGINIYELKDADSKGVLLALSAAFFWSVCTVVGKKVLNRGELLSSVVSFWRFFFGLIGMLVLTLLSPQSSIDLAFITVDPSVVQSLAYMAIIPGWLGVSLYYKGLSRVTASVTTILELSFPLCAIAVNSYILKLPLQWTQLIAAAVLLGAMTALSIAQKKQP